MLMDRRSIQSAFVFFNGLFLPSKHFLLAENQRPEEKRKIFLNMATHWAIKRQPDLIWHLFPRVQQKVDKESNEPWRFWRKI